MRSDRTEDEWAAVRAEAERRVRAGEAAARVAKELGVAMATFQHWQAEDGWRLKDLKHEELTGEPMPQPVWLVKNALRGQTGRNPLPADYVHRMESARARVAAREAELKASRRADAGEAGRVAMGEAARLYQAGEIGRASETARLAERFLRLEQRVAGTFRGGSRGGQSCGAAGGAPTTGLNGYIPVRAEEPCPPGYSQLEWDLENDPDNPDRTHRDAVAEKLRKLIARLEAKRDATPEGEESDFQQSGGDAGAGDAAEALRGLSEGAEEGAAHPLGIAEAGLAGDDVDGAG